MKTVGTRAARGVVAAALVLWLAVALVPLPRPTPQPLNAPPTEFSALRAMDYVRAIAQKPHPTGTPEHDRVRDYVRGELARLGLGSELETGYSEITWQQYHYGTDVSNIVARLPGTANTRPVLLAAHYDSAPAAPGASDDGHGVAVLLETLRALRAATPLRNDVIFLITDGEERGLLGASLFMREHPWRSEPGVALNFEARGTSGSAMMFETSSGNEWLIRGLQEVVPEADATSVAYEIYRRMPNNTDLSIFKRGGLAGMNFAFIEHPEYYHRSGDTAEHLDPVSLQEQGRYALSLARWFGNRDLTLHDPGDAIYFPTAFTGLLVYPATWALALVGLAAIVGVIASWASQRNHRGGLPVGVPLALLVVADWYMSTAMTGASYLVAWPLLGAMIATLVLATAPPKVGVGWQVGLLAVCAAPTFILIVPLLSNMVVALTLRGAAPLLIVAGVLMTICLLPQLVFVGRKSYVRV